MTPPPKKETKDGFINLAKEFVDGTSSIDKMLIELEGLRRMQVKEAVQARIWRMGADLARRYKEQQNKEELIARERAAEALRQEAALLAKLRHEEHLAAVRHQQLTLEHEQSTKRMNEVLKEMEKKQEEERRTFEERKIILTKIYESQMSFRMKYQQILEASKSCKYKQAFISAISPHLAKLRSLYESMDSMVKKCKTGEVQAEDGEKSALLDTELNSILAIVIEETAKINSKVEAETTEQAALVTPELSTKSEEIPTENVVQIDGPQKSLEPKTSEENSTVRKSTSAMDRISDELKDHVHPDCLKKYISLQNYLKEFEKSYEPLFSDNRYKKFRIDCQKIVNTSVNAISPVSSAHMLDKLVHLRLLLKGEMVEVGDTRVTSSAHPNGIAYCKNLLAKKLVKQGEQTVSSKPNAAFAIAAVIVALWNEFYDFGQLLLAHFYKECPYLVPFYIPQQEGQSDEDYYKALGYRYSEDGTVEKQDKFLKRMSGVMRLYSAILVTRQMRQYQNIPHPHGVANGWCWMAATLNLKPQPDICASLLFDFLEVSGNGMATHYGSQFQKLLHITCKEYYPRLKEVTPEGSGGPVTRLLEFLQITLRNGGFIPPPKALISQPPW